MVFQDRQEAGERVAEELVRRGLVSEVDKVVVSIPRGGCVVGKVIADRLGCRHEVLVTKKIGLPGREEMAIGAVAEDGEAVIDEKAVQKFGLAEERLEVEESKVRLKVNEYIDKFRAGKELVITEEVVILVDDGVATGETMMAALGWLKRKYPGKRVVVAVPLAWSRAIKNIGEVADEVVCLEKPADFRAVGQFYSNFDQVSDEKVVRLLRTR